MQPGVNGEIYRQLKGQITVQLCSGHKYAGKNSSLEQNLLGYIKFIFKELKRLCWLFNVQTEHGCCLAHVANELDMLYHLCY